MLRRAGFKRQVYKAAPPAPPTRGRMASMGPAHLRAIEKPKEWRNPHLLAMAKGKPCLFRLPGICNHNPETTVAAHSNLSIHGKGGARKANDQYSAWACSACHSWFDAGPSPAEHKAEWFKLAHADQVLEWRRIAFDRSGKPKDKAAVIAALTALDCWPAVDGSEL